MSTASFDLQSRKIEEFRTLTEPYKKELAGITIEILAGVYPGGTDSELLCESMTIAHGDDVLDLCTGNGIVALVASSKGANSVVGTDLNPMAVKNANLNVRLLAVDNVSIIETDLFPDTKQTYDVITINPPYTDNQAPDKIAICFWDKNNQVVKSFFHNLQKYLKPSGRAYITWSNFADQELLFKLADENQLDIKLVKTRDGKSGFRYYVYGITAI